MESNYIKIFSGNIIEGQKIEGALRDIGIEAVVKDEGESGRLAGFPSPLAGQVDIYVHKDELEKAQAVLQDLS